MKQRCILPGKRLYRDISYWLVDSNKATQMVDEVIRGIDRERNAEIKVTVQEWMRILRRRLHCIYLMELRFDVISVGNADNLITTKLWFWRKRKP